MRLLQFLCMDFLLSTGICTILVKRDAPLPTSGYNSSPSGTSNGYNLGLDLPAHYDSPNHGTSSFIPQSGYSQPILPLPVYRAPNQKPSSNYGPPSKQAPNGNYNKSVKRKPSPSYSAPSKPSQLYGAPSFSSSGFTNSYSSSQSITSYGPPPSGYFSSPAVPQSNYRAPSISSIPSGIPSGPSSNYGISLPAAPSTNYGTPSLPSSDYEISSVSSQYGAPPVPSITYESPRQRQTSYGAPNSIPSSQSSGSFGQAYDNNGGYVY